MPTKVLITDCFYPLKEGGTEKFFGGIYFDNPRTKDEIDYVAKVLKEINYSQKLPYPEKDEQVPEGCITLRWIIDKFYENNNDDKQVQEYYAKTLKDKNVYKALARMWIIIRCDEIIDKNAKKKLFCIVSDNNIKNIDKYRLSNNDYNVEKIDKYLKILAFMSNPSCRVNISMIINNPLRFDMMFKQTGIFPKLLTLCVFNKKLLKKSDEPPICVFNVLFEYYKKYIDLIEDKYTDEKFLFICECISNFTETMNEKMCLIGIVGLIEMLIAHNPDTSRHNVEESINKQFVKKTKYILYRKDKTIDMDKVDKELKLAYSIRSDIAHGNFNNESKKHLDKLFDFYKLDKEGTGINYNDYNTAIECLNSSLAIYLHSILELYLEDELELQLIKDI